MIITGVFFIGRNIYFLNSIMIITEFFIKLDKVDIFSAYAEIYDNTISGREKQWFIRETLSKHFV